MTILVFLDMKRTREGLFPTPSIPLERQKGRSVWELLIADGQTDLLVLCIVRTNSREMRALMLTCKALYSATCELFKSRRMFVVPYMVSLKATGLVCMTGFRTVPVHGHVWPNLEFLKRKLEVDIVEATPLSNANILLCPPVEIDQTDPYSREWWKSHNSEPLLPLDVARAHAKEKRKRELDAWAREAGLLPLPSSALLNLPAEPWH